MLKVLILAFILVGMALRIIFVRGGRFPQISIGKNRQMRELGITCVKHDEIRCHKRGGGNTTGCGCV